VFYHLLNQCACLSCHTFHCIIIVCLPARVWACLPGNSSRSGAIWFILYPHCCIKLVEVHRAGKVLVQVSSHTTAKSRNQGLAVKTEENWPHPTSWHSCQRVIHTKLPPVASERRMSFSLGLASLAPHIGVWLRASSLASHW
jgi:hypothetical protein